MKQDSYDLSPGTELKVCELDLESLHRAVRSPALSQGGVRLNDRIGYLIPFISSLGLLKTMSAAVQMSAAFLCKIMNLPLFL